VQGHFSSHLREEGGRSSFHSKDGLSRGIVKETQFPKPIFTLASPIEKDNHSITYITAIKQETADSKPSFALLLRSQSPTKYDSEMPLPHSKHNQLFQSSFTMPYFAHTTPTTATTTHFSTPLATQERNATRDVRNFNTSAAIPRFG